MLSCAGIIYFLKWPVGELGLREEVCHRGVAVEFEIEGFGVVEEVGFGVAGAVGWHPGDGEVVPGAV